MINMAETYCTDGEFNRESYAESNTSVEKAVVNETETVRGYKPNLKLICSEDNVIFISHSMAKLSPTINSWLMEQNTQDGDDQSHLKFNMLQFDIELVAKCFIYLNMRCDGKEKTEKYEEFNSHTSAEIVEIPLEKLISLAEVAKFLGIYDLLKSTCEKIQNLQNRRSLTEENFEELNKETVKKMVAQIFGDKS